MIRIRFPSDAAVPAWLLSHLREGYVELTDDPRVIAVEEEKNTASHRKEVDLILKPLFSTMWEQGSQLFGLVSIETRAGCNYTCSFCPVARSVDPRRPGEMSLKLLNKIVLDLSALQYSGRICFFGNNEPLLDGRLSGIISMFRSECPHADMRVLTNGTRAGVHVVSDLFRSGLSTLTINNYTEGQRLIRPVRTLIESAELLRLFDIRISIRRRDELLTTRAGLAPNKPVPDEIPRGFCALPFTDLHISYTGDVNICCFDAHGRVSVGNVADMSITEIWSSATLQTYRQRLLRSSREGICANCDFDGYRDPQPNREKAVVRNDLKANVGVNLEQDRNS